MSDEERQRQMDFIVAQQADNTVKIQQLLEAQAASDKRIGALERGFVSLFNIMQEVVKTQHELVKTQQENSAQLASLMEAQKNTDERLNAFIFVLERSIGGNGNARASSRKTWAKKRASRK